MLLVLPKGASDKKTLPSQLSRIRNHCGVNSSGTFYADELVLTFENRNLQLRADHFNDIGKPGQTVFTLIAGDKLPSERNLIEILDSSRPRLREALRALSILGVVESQRHATKQEKIFEV